MAHYDAREETLDRDGLRRLQRTKLAALWGQIMQTNAFYRRKLAAAGLGAGGVFDPLRDPLERLPLTTRAEIEADQLAHPPYGTNLTFAAPRYVRLHQTSGSTGAPLRWLDTRESWEWCKRCWAIVYRGAGLRDDDRVAFAFSFGPFIGFWMAFEAAAMLGNMCLAAGGMTTAARIRYILENRATVVCCTPTYALHMAEVASAEQVDLRSSAVRMLIVAGEPGGSIPATRARMEDAWAARVVDHAGMTEIGAWGFEPDEAPGGLHVIESEFIAEVIDPDALTPVGDGALGELVLTSLGRAASPLIRYRTGDLVRLSRPVQAPWAGRWFARCEGGILGRRDDMLIVRGNNVFPAAVENVLRAVPEVLEYRLAVVARGGMNELRIDVEGRPGPESHAGHADALAARVAAAVRDALGFRPLVRVVAAGTLPRFEMKARRVQPPPPPGR